jgi:uncharacterized membrane protein YcaP (DUF421 family)
MHENIIQASVHSLVSIIVLFIFARLAGKKQISQLSFFHYVIGISIGSIAAAFAVDVDIEFPEFLVSVIIYGLFPLILSQISMKSYKGRKILNGSPTILIQDGKIIENNLRKTRINIDELLEECRLKNAFNLSEVEFAVLETNGQVSVQMKSPSLPLTPKDMEIGTQYKGLCANLIVDGAVLNENLSIIGKDKKWLKSQLEQQGITSISDILLVFIDSSDKLYIYKKGENPKLYTVI